MVLDLKVRKVGNSLGIILPKEALAHLNIAEGDTICATESPDGTLRLITSRPAVVKQLEAAQSILKRYRHTLQELAK